MLHRVSEVNAVHCPSMARELILNYPLEILVVDGVVAVEGGAIVVEYNCFLIRPLIVSAKIRYYFTYLALVFHIKALKHSQYLSVGLSCNYPIDVCIIVHPDAKWAIRIEVGVCPAIERGWIELIA